MPEFGCRPGIKKGGELVEHRLFYVKRVISFAYYQNHNYLRIMKDNP